MAATSRIPAHLPNMNAPSISFIRNLGEFLTTSQLLWQDAEARPGTPATHICIICLLTFRFACPPQPNGWGLREMGLRGCWLCNISLHTSPHVHTPTRSRHISCATHPPGSVRPYRPRMHADHARAHPWPSHHMPRLRKLRSVLRGPNRRSL